jgi:pimeloyl-ACP methyl ester carboxylesterase
LRGAIDRTKTFLEFAPGQSAAPRHRTIEMLDSALLDHLGQDTIMWNRLLLAPLALTALMTADAPETPPPPSAAVVRNIVLVHGAYADGSSYAKVIPLLLAQGYRVTAVQNPLSSLADDVAATRRAIARQDGPVILVGHSSAGVVITEAGNDPKVAGLVYISAIIPDAGQSASEAVKGYPATPGLAEQKPDAKGYLTITRKGVIEDFVPDIPMAEREIVFATQGDWNSTFLHEKVTTAAWKTRPSWVVIVNDRMVPPGHERESAKRIGATTITLKTGHVPMLSNPKAIASVIVDAATKSTAPLAKVGSR